MRRTGNGRTGAASAIAAVFLLAAFAASCGPPGPATMAPEAPPRAPGERAEAPTWTPAAVPTATPNRADALFGEARAAFLAGRGNDARTKLEQYAGEFPAGEHLAAVEAMRASLAEAASPTAGPIRIGAVLPLTGKHAKYGAGAKKAVELAVRRHNANATPSARVELLVEDSASEPAKAGTAAASLVAAGCIGLVGPLTGSELAACVQPAVTAGVPILAPAAGGKTAAGGLGIVTLGVSPDMQGAEIRRYAGTRRLRRVAALFPRTAYGQAVATALGATSDGAGVTVVEAVPYTPGQSDFGAEIQKLGGGDAKASRDEEEREKNFIQDQAEAAMRDVLAIVAPGQIPETATATPKPVKKKKKMPSPTATASPTPPPVSEVAPKVLVFDWVSEDAAAALPRLDHKFGSRLALLLRQQPSLEIVGGGEFLRMAEDAGVAVEMESGSAEESFAAAVQRLGITHVVSGSVASAGPALAVHTRVYAVAARALLLDSVQFLDQPPPPQKNPQGLDAIVVAGRGNDVLQLVSQLAFFDLRVPVIGTADWDPDEILRAGEKAMAGCVFPTAFYPKSGRAEARDFVRLYGEAYAAAPDLWAAQAFDCATLLLGPVALGVRDRRVLREELAAIKDRPVATGIVTVQGPGEATKRLSFLEIREGGSLEEIRP